MINLCILINSLASGGAEKVAALLCKEYVRAGINVIFVCLEKNNFYEIADNNIYYLSDSTGEDEGFLKKFFSLFTYAARLKRILRKHEASVVQSHIYRANYVNVLSGIFGSSHKTQLVNHGIVSRYKKEGLAGRINLFLIRHLYSRADQFVFPSKGMKDDLERLGTFTNDKVVIHNPFDVDGILEAKDVLFDESEFQFAPNRKYLVAVGRLEKVKRYADIIESLGLLRQSRIEIEFVLLGDGPEKDNLMANAIKFGVKDSVHFLGRVTNPFKYIARADMLVSASEYEGFSNVIVEALICGTPVISTDCASGPREILAPDSDESCRLDSGDIELAEFGILVPVGDTEMITSAVEKLLSDKDLAEEYSSKGIKRAKAFDKEVIAGKYIECMKELVDS